MIPSFATALAHQQRKVHRYERLARTQPELGKRLMTARITVAAMELVQEYQCEHMVMCRVSGGAQ